MAIGTHSNDNGPSQRRIDTKNTVAWALRTAAVLTTSYVASSHMPIQGAPNVAFELTCASVDYTSIECIVEVSNDASAWFELPISGFTLASNKSATAPLILVTAATPCHIYARISIKRTGGTATGTVAVTGYAGTGS